jgi:SAM-dependent methyltransferase
LVFNFGGKNELAVSHFGGRKFFNHMSFAKPNFNTEPSKPEQEPLGPDLLQEQARLPKDQWSEKFRQLIEEKIKENQQRNEEKESPEVLRERTFKRYTEGLGLGEKTLRDKKVLDLGAGKGEFVKFLIEKGITSEAYGIDAGLDEVVVEDKLKRHLFRGNFEEDLPVKNADYVISVGAVSNGIWGGDEVMNIRRIVEKSLASLKEGGEIRIYPIQEASKATPLEGLEKSQQKWGELLAKISETQKVECRIEPRDIKVVGNSNDIILESVLVIRRKKD